MSFIAGGESGTEDEHLDISSSSSRRIRAIDFEKELKDEYVGDDNDSSIGWPGVFDVWSAAVVEIGWTVVVVELRGIWFWWLVRSTNTPEWEEALYISTATSTVLDTDEAICKYFQ